MYSAHPLEGYMCITKHYSLERNLLIKGEKSTLRVYFFSKLVFMPGGYLRRGKNNAGMYHIKQQAKTLAKINRAGSHMM